jgi:diguanylate cyclase (GGDEF)-like protein
MKKTGNGNAFRLVLGIAAIVFFSAVVLLGVLGGLDADLRNPLAVFLIAALLAAVAAPCVYWLCGPALRREDVAREPTPDMSALTVTDPLTHVMNRRGITMGVLEAMAQAERYNTPLSVAVVDVDGFARVNEEHGKSTGDKVLADLAGVLADTLRMPDKVGRYDGEEFLAVLPHTGITPAKKIAERIRSAVHGAKLGNNGKRVNLTVSVGVTQYTKGADLEHLLSRAHAAVEAAKRDGGNRVVAKKNS